MAAEHTEVLFYQSPEKKMCAVLTKKWNQTTQGPPTIQHFFLFVHVFIAIIKIPVTTRAGL